MFYVVSVTRTMFIRIRSVRKHEGFLYDRHVRVAYAWSLSSLSISYAPLHFFMRDAICSAVLTDAFCSVARW